MKELLYTAYVAAQLLWIPLGILAILKPSMRRRVLVPLVMSAMGGLYEIAMRAAYPQAIRIDIFLVLFVLGAVDAISGFSLLIGARGRPDKEWLKLAGGLCLAVPAMAIGGFAYMHVETADVDHNLGLARRFRFEAAFRDDDTQKRIFGDLAAGRNPFAGYYVYAGNTDDRFAHLVINDAGRFWIYHSMLYEYAGVGSLRNAGEFNGFGDGRMNSGMRMSLRRQEGGPFLLQVNYAGNIPEPTDSKAAPMRKAAPPRFPRPPAAVNEVRFAGVYSGKYGEKGDGFWLTQVWLWESRGVWWGQYIRDHYKRGSVREFVSTERIDPVCSEQCKVLSFKTSRGPVRLTLVSADEIAATGQGEDKVVTLKREETLPGFVLDLAPLATRKENNEWLTAMTTANMITWKVPP